VESRVITFSRNVFIPLTRVCRNQCSYCSFRQTVSEGALMKPEEVEAILREGAQAGCTEALFTFGEHPELEPGFLPLLEQIGYPSIIDYCRDMCRRSIRAGLLPHTNAGVLSYTEMKRLAPFNASMGLMLETTADIPAHNKSPGKRPDLRLSMIANAGRLRIPFTTGILVGVGETAADRQNSLREIARLHRRYGHIQEVIIQNFCPREGMEMEHIPGPDAETMRETVRMARRILPAEISVQVPPNLADAKDLIRDGAGDLGGISPLTIDYINPDHPWPEFSRLREIAQGFSLRERLCIYPSFIARGWFHPRLSDLVLRLQHDMKKREIS
jgi:7,8-didemethyl-8-hydroxy-5-deazariboflavin synthase